MAKRGRRAQRSLNDGPAGLQLRDCRHLDSMHLGRIWKASNHRSNDGVVQRHCMQRVEGGGDGITGGESVGHRKKGRGHDMRSCRGGDLGGLLIQRELQAIHIPPQLHSQAYPQNATASPALVTQRWEPTHTHTEYELFTPMATSHPAVAFWVA